MLIAHNRSFCIIKEILNLENDIFIFKDFMQMDKLHTFLMNGTFYKMAFMVDLRIDIRTKEMLNITPYQKSCVISWVISIVKICKTKVGLEL